MAKILTIPLLLLSLAGFCFSQHTAPVKWEKYSEAERSFTVLFPKLPTLTVSSCFKEDSWTYAAYTDGVVYVLSVNARSKLPRACKDPRRDGYDARMGNLKKELENVKGSPAAALGDFTGVRLEAKNTVHLFYRHPENKREWYELWVVGADDSKPEVKNFLSSLAIDKQTTGRAIGGGSPRMLGDRITSDCFIPKPPTKTDKEKKAGAKAKEAENGDDGDDNKNQIQLVLKPFPYYTEAARNKGISGAVIFEITFGAGGDLADAVVIQGLPDGLTERALETVSKIAFIPLKKDGKFCTAVKELRYMFNFDVH